MPDVQDMDLALKFKWKKKKHPLTTDDLTRLLTPLGATDVAPLTEKRKGHTVAIFKTVVDAVRRR
jgi:DnaJ family protein C protein 17